MHCGLAHLAGDTRIFQYAFAGQRPLTGADLSGLTRFMESIDADRPLLLASACPGFEASPEAEAGGIVFAAGYYRRLQERARQNGLQMVCCIERIAVGGSYLAHGLGADIRLALTGTEFYDTVHPGRCVPLTDVLAQGLVSRITDPHELAQALGDALFGDSPS